MTFQLVWRTQIVMLTVLVQPESVFLDVPPGRGRLANICQLTVANIRQLTDVLQCKLHQYLRQSTSSSALSAGGFSGRLDRRTKEPR